MNKQTVIEQTVLQPAEFRREGNPQWAYVGAFRVLLGFGPGVWEMLGDRMAGLQRICLVDKHFLESARRTARGAHGHAYRAEHLPLEIEVAGHEDEMCPAIERPLDEQVQFVLRTSSMEAPSFSVIHLEKRRAKWITDAMIVFGATELPQRRKRANGGENPVFTDGQKALMAYITERKEEAFQKRLREIIAYPSHRPPHFEETKLRLLRSREGEVQRGKKGEDGLPYRPYTEEDLFQRTCSAVAGQEAGEIVFEKTPVPLYTLDDTGITVH